jgi:arylsulfatase A-like enzyme
MNPEEGNKSWMLAVPLKAKALVCGVPGLLLRRTKDLFSALTAFHLVSLFWTAFLLLTAVLVCFRGIIHAGMFSLIPLDETPSVTFLNEHYDVIYASAVGAGVALLVGYAVALFKHLRTDKLSRTFVGSTALLVALVAFTCRFSGGEAIVQTEDLGFLDWLTALIMPGVSALLMLVIGRRVGRHTTEQAAPFEMTERKLNRKALVYLLGTVAVFLYVIPIHAEFWALDDAHGVVYTKFLKPDEVFDAHVVLYSCSLLFSSVAALCALFSYSLYKRALRSSEEEGVSLSVANCRNVSMVLGFAWSFAAVAPWMLKIWPDIVAEDGEVLLAVTFMAAWSSLIPLIYVSMLMLKKDDDEASVGQSKPGMLRGESSFIAFAIAPFYPWVRLFWPRKKVWLGGGLILLSAGAMLMLADYIDNFEVDGFDFRDTLRKSQIPFLRVYLSLALAWLFYIVVQRGYWAGAKLIDTVRRWLQREEPLRAHPIAVRATQLTVFVAAGLVALSSSLPLWFWDSRDISLNTYARCVEHSYRHEFELIFLHNVFDLDQDGYSSLLHGGDPDDFDSDITATGFPPLKAVDLLVDRFEVTDEAKLKAFPNFLFLTLEGVTPSTLSSYGKRRLDEGRVATPHMDAIAKEGTVFTNARAAYPSTWDAWLMINSGRYLRVTEMDNILSFEDRYSKHNNIRKVFRKVGVSRWAHAHAAAYTQMMIGPERHDENFENEEYSDISDEEADWGMYRGDRNLERVIRFIDSLKSGERFFIAEHMQDTHFPWKRTTEQKAKDMGYEEGLSWVEKDGIQHSDEHLCYLQEVTRMDWQIGQIIQALKRRKLYENTMVVVMSDHGSQWLEHGHLYYPGHIYDPALRIPVIMRVPGLDGKGRMVDAPVIQMDLLTTLLELAGLEHANEEETGPLPGCSLAPFLNGTETAADERCCAERDMIITTHYDMVGYIDDFKYKLIVDRPLGCYFLFDLINDPGETENLADSHPELLERMLEGMREQNRLYPGFLAGIAR